MIKVERQAAVGDVDGFHLATHSATWWLLPWGEHNGDLLPLRPGLPFGCGLGVGLALLMLQRSILRIDAEMTV